MAVILVGEDIVLAQETAGFLDVAFGHVNAITIDIGIVAQLFPRQPVVFLTNAEEAAEAQDDERDTSIAFFQHQALDMTDLLAIRTEHLGPLDPVAGDQHRHILDVEVTAHGIGTLFMHARTSLWIRFTYVGASDPPPFFQGDTMLRWVFAHGPLTRSSRKSSSPFLKIVKKGLTPRDC
ncbi:hypothetical protein Arad_0747 [Rhizobium rhizogenes K84]|uniref:Uncharacterized protein n=1 Tax=Rhizobium rhizogenes (strain K84 / ATCC BAA-868) TaxID=311403 RepID=B9J8I1_RHIR8|nr:hypothetical protein Arad_0747 [Rhizobium rhizogenes K84]